MLVTLVACYFAVTIAIGVYAARRVKNSADYLVAGRSLPLYMNTATVFATWFGAELILAVSSTFLKDGLRGVVGDPFGAAFCLIFVALFLAAPYYRLKLMTVSDFYKKRYNRTVELASAAAISISYLGWASANLVALGIVIHTVSGHAIPLEQGIVLGAVIVGVYTLFGGMWSVAFTDLFQTVIIVAGLLYIAWMLAGMAGGVDKVIITAQASDRLKFFPDASLHDWLGFIAAFVTMALGSVAQQDVFQRVTSARTEKIARTGTLLGGSFYLIMAFVPMFIAYSATLIDPAFFNALLENDPQRVLPTLVLQHTPVFAQAIFFGAVLAAIMSCSSATLLAPSVAFSENVIRGFFPGISDRAFLRLMRITIVGFTCLVLGFALVSDASIFEMVESAYKITLAGAFVPLFFGAYWRRATAQGALFAIFGGVASWIILELAFGEAFPVPPQLIGFALSILGMLAGSLLPQKFGRVAPLAAP